MAIAIYSHSGGMFRPFHIPAGTLTADRIIALLNRGRRVIIEIVVTDQSHEVELRLSKDGTYYCDGPLALSTHTSENEMRTWLLNQGYATE